MTCPICEATGPELGKFRACRTSQPWNSRTKKFPRKLVEIEVCKICYEIFKGTRILELRDKLKWNYAYHHVKSRIPAMLRRFPWLDERYFYDNHLKMIALSLPNNLTTECKRFGCYNRIPHRYMSNKKIESPDYCSKDCYRKDTETPTERQRNNFRECVVCHTKFESNLAGQKTCTFQCRNKYKEQPSGKLRGRSSTILTCSTCPHCGVMYWAKPNTRMTCHDEQCEARQRFDAEHREWTMAKMDEPGFFDSPEEVEAPIKVESKYVKASAPDLPGGDRAAQALRADDEGLVPDDEGLVNYPPMEKYVRERKEEAAVRRRERAKERRERRVTYPTTRDATRRAQTALNRAQGRVETRDAK